MKIYILESNPDIGQCLVDYFECAGHTAYLFNSYDSAKNILYNDIPDIVILSRHLKGGEVSRLAQDAMSRKIKTIVISTNKEADISCHGFLPQPFELAALEKMIFNENRY